MNKVLSAELNYVRRNKASLLDWNYEVTKKSVFVVQMPHSEVGGFFENQWFMIELIWIGEGDSRTEAVRITLQPKYAWNGCSVAPDIDGALQASSVHDPIYQFCEVIAAAWKWKQKQVLAFADTLFNLIMAFFKVTPWVRTVYYKAVSWLGYPFHEINLWKHSLLS